MSSAFLSACPRLPARAAPNLRADGFRLGHPAVSLVSRAAEKQTTPVGLIVGAIGAGIALLTFLFVVLGPCIDRRRETARVAREGGNPTDAEAPSAADLEARFQRSGADLAPVMQQAPRTPMVAVPLTPAGEAVPAKADPFRTPPASPKEKAEDPFADEVAAMQARLQEKFKVAHDRYQA
jgi:hypothetical protein